MSTLNFIITNAGRQAAIDADAMGIKLTITDVGYGTGNWSPDKTATALQTEFKRLAAGGGENPAPLYVHIAVTDQSSDTYQANEVGIYAGDVLFAIWSKDLQPELDGPGKINTGDSAFVFDLLLDNVPPDSVTVGDANFSVPLSTETVPGIIPTATPEAVEAFEGIGAIIPPLLGNWWNKEKKRFGSAAFKNAGTDSGEVMPVGAFGFGKSSVSSVDRVHPESINKNSISWTLLDAIIPGQGNSSYAVLNMLLSELFMEQILVRKGKLFCRSKDNQVWGDYIEYISKGDFVVSGNSLGGHLILPGGFMFQCGLVTDMPSNTSRNVTLPISYSNVIWMVGASLKSSRAANPGTTSVYANRISGSNSQITVVMDPVDEQAARDLFWWTVGV